MAEAINGEIVAEAPASVVSLGSLRGSSGVQLVQSASALASTLRDIINDRGLYKHIQGRDYVMCEGWTTLATLCGLMPREVACERDETGAYVAVVSLVRIADGVELTRASAECGGDGDELWQKRAAYARRSMAITRATGKVCRISLSWVMNLAGFQPTPLEEMEQAEREIEARAVEQAQTPPTPEPPLVAPATIGKDKQQAVWKLAAVRVKELIERRDLTPKAQPDLIMRDVLRAWNLEHTADIPRKQYEQFVALVNRWVPGAIAEEMRPTEEF
jgi:hypothetical protein